MKTPALPLKHDSAGAGRPDRLSVTPMAGTAYFAELAEAVAAIVCATLASAIVVTAIALVML